MNKGLYLRAFILSCIDVFLMLPVGMLTLAADYGHSNLQFWPGWEAIHGKWRPIYEPKSHWSQSFWVAFGVKADRFMYPCLGLIFFCIFGLTKQAVDGYRVSGWKFLGILGFKRPENCIASAVIFESNDIESTC